MAKLGDDYVHIMNYVSFLRAYEIGIYYELIWVDKSWFRISPFSSNRLTLLPEFFPRWIELSGFRSNAATTASIFLLPMWPSVLFIHPPQLRVIWNSSRVLPTSLWISACNCRIIGAACSGTNTWPIKPYPSIYPISPTQDPRVVWICSILHLCSRTYFPIDTLASFCGSKE